MIEWNTPWFLLLALQPFIIVVMRKLFENRQLKHYVNKELQPWVTLNSKPRLTSSRFLKNSAYFIAWCLFAIAAAGPRVAEDVPGKLATSGSDIMIVLDISQSMQATDLAPNRLRQAHQKISYLVEQANNSRVGLIVYAAKPHLFVPLTYDKNALRFYIRQLEYLQPPSQGSLTSIALQLAYNRLNSNEPGNSDRNMSIVLITDADTTEHNKPGEHVSKNRANNIPIHTLIMASNNGEAVPAFEDGWLSVNGRPVISRPKLDYYSSLSSRSNGVFARTLPDNSGIRTLVDTINNVATSSTRPAAQQLIWKELFAWFLFPAILFLLISMSPYKILPVFSKKTGHAKIASYAIFSCLLVVALASNNAHASQYDLLDEAYSAFNQRDYIKAKQLYASVNGFPGLYGEASATYRLENYARAARLFEQAVLLATTNNEFTRALYNLGNSYFNTGNYALAIASFEDALIYSPAHAASQDNLVYAKRALVAVEDRQKLMSVTTRSGRGPRTARVAENIIINEDSSVSLAGSDAEDTNKQENAIASSIDIPEFIILRGLEFAKQSESSHDEEKQARLIIEPVTTQLGLLDNMHDSQPTLWNRIFELEEGYPAPRDKPAIIPGIQPW